MWPQMVMLAQILAAEREANVQRDLYFRELQAETGSSSGNHPYRPSALLLLAVLALSVIAQMVVV